MAQAMEEGAFGLSTSLIYVPGRFASTEEIVALAKVARRYGGTYITHQRDEAYKIDKSLDEVFRIAARGGDPRGDLPPEDGGQGELGPHARGPRAASRRRGPRASTSRPTSIPGSPARTASTPACRPGCARAGGRSWSRASRTRRCGPGEGRFAKDDPSWENQTGRRRRPGILIGASSNPALKKYEGRTLERDRQGREARTRST